MKAILTKYVGASTTKPAYYKASDSDGHTAIVKESQADGSENGHDKAAIALCHKMSWRSNDLVQGGIKIGLKSYNVYTFDHPDNKVRV